MKYRKVKGNGILLAVYMVFLCVVFSAAVRELCVRYIEFPSAWDVPIIAACSVAVIFLISLLLESFLKFQSREQKGSFYWWEWLFLIGAVVLAVWFRLHSAGLPTANPVWFIGLSCVPVGMILLYPAIRMLFGKTTAVFTLIYMAVSLQFTEADYVFVLFSILYLLTVWLFVRLCDKDSASWPIVVLIGIITGVFSGWNPVYLAIFLLGIAGMIQIDDPTLKRCRVSASVIYLVSAAAGFVGYGLFRMLYLRETAVQILAYLAGWWKGIMLIKPEEILVCIPFAVLYIFGQDHKSGRNGLVWLPAFLYLNIQCRETMISILAWVIMAGLGLQSMICEKQKAQTEEKKSEAILPGEPIPNPLPGPRKHVRKEMDYAFIPEESKMCFDINELEEGKDQFDIE